ncbi:MAG TPA: hypothetical protein VK939_14205, partial [Longimicrobiales bacterium]|nr:hypothetical protein [Longimicrobiales bacterium]
MSSRIPSVLLAALALTVMAPAAGAQQTRVKIRSADELPRHTYAVPGSASRLLEDDAAFATFAARLAADL